MDKAVVTNLNSNKVRDGNETVTLYEWVQTHYTEEEMRSIFLNMDRALKYIHEHDYCIEVFYPTEINVLYDEDDYIQFKRLMQLPNDPIMKKEMIREDIFNSALIQIGLYSKSLKYLKPDFLRENFDSFSHFIPSDDIPYYRGVVQRGASVYYCEYFIEKRKRELAELEKQLGDEPSSNIDLDPSNAELTNKKVNDVIYRQINGLSEAAFANLLIIPTIMLAIIFIVTIIMLIIGLFV